MPRVLRSFRLRIALLSVAMSGAVLLLFASWAWTAVYRANLGRVDDSLRDIAQRHLSFRHGPGHWGFVDQSLQFVFGEDTGRVVLVVIGADGALIHRSPDWPQGLDRIPSVPPGALTEPVPTYAAPDEPGIPPPPFFGTERRPDGPGDMPRGEGFPRRGPPPDMGQRGGPGGPRDGRPRFDGPRPPDEFQVESVAERTMPGEHTLWRVAVFRNPEVTFAIGVGLTGFTARVAAARSGFLIAFPLALALIAVGSWYLANRALRPVKRVSDAIAQVTARGLDQRVPEAGETEEFQQLIAQFNRMMERLERSFTQAARFSADAAHELKTPLAVLQGEIEQALQTAPQETQEVLSTLLDEVQRLKSITQKLLLLARADAGQLSVHLEALDLSALVRDLVEDVEVAAEGMQVKSQIADKVMVLGDRDLLRQVLQNLADNAIKYSAGGGIIAFALGVQNNLAILRVANSGRIPQEKRERIFDRFVRVDDARSRRVEGAGLGLSLAREIARAHGGELLLEGADDGMVTFALRLHVTLV